MQLLLVRRCDVSKSRTGRESRATRKDQTWSRRVWRIKLWNRTRFSRMKLQITTGTPVTNRGSSEQHTGKLQGWWFKGAELFHVTASTLMLSVLESRRVSCIFRSNDDCFEPDHLTKWVLKPILQILVVQTHVKLKTAVILLGVADATRDVLKGSSSRSRKYWICKHVFLFLRSVERKSYYHILNFCLLRKSVLDLLLPVIHKFPQNIWKNSYTTLKTFLE